MVVKTISYEVVEEKVVEEKVHVRSEELEEELPT
jgi:hypothetical protein